MDRTEVELVPWLRDRLRGLSAEGMKKRLAALGMGFKVPSPDTTPPGRYLVYLAGAFEICQLVCWNRLSCGDVLLACTMVGTSASLFSPGCFLEVPEKYLQFKKEGDEMEEMLIKSVFTPLKVKADQLPWMGETKVRFIPETLDMIKSLLPNAPNVRARKLFEKGFKTVSLTSAFAGDYVVDIGGDSYGNLLQIKKWWSPDTILVLDEKGGECVYHPDSLLRIPNYYLQSVEPSLLATEHQRVPEVGERYTIGIDPAVEESVATYYMGKECAPVYRSPKSFVCEYGGQSLTFNEVGCTSGKQGYVVCPTTGRKLNPNTLLPIEEHVDFTTRGIL